MADESSISTQVQKQNEQAVQAWNKKLIKDLKKRAAQESAENKDAINKMIKKLMSSANEGSIASFLKTVPGKKPTKTKNKGGSIKKGDPNYYAHGGSVRKTKLSDY